MYSEYVLRIYIMYLIDQSCIALQYVWLLPPIRNAAADSAASIERHMRNLIGHCVPRIIHLTYIHIQSTFDETHNYFSSISYLQADKRVKECPRDGYMRMNNCYWTLTMSGYIQYTLSSPCFSALESRCSRWNRKVGYSTLYYSSAKQYSCLQEMSRLNPILLQTSDPHAGEERQFVSRVAVVVVSRYWR